MSQSDGAPKAIEKKNTAEDKVREAKASHNSVQNNGGENPHFHSRDGRMALSSFPLAVSIAIVFHGRRFQQMDQRVAQSLSSVFRLA